MKTNFGWSLPPGCSGTPFDDVLPPCCEECEEEGNDPNCMDTCKKYKKFLEESDAADEAMYASFSDPNFTHKDYIGDDE